MQIGCKEFKRIVVEKNREIETGILGILHGWLREGCEEMLSSFSGLRARLVRTCSNIEELHEMRTFLETVGDLIEDLKDGIRNELSLYRVLDGFHYTMSQATLYALYEMQLGPARVYELVESAEQKLASARALFHAEFTVKQREFAEELEGLADLIGRFWQNSDVSRLQDVAHDVEMIHERLQSSVTTSALFNRREVLFDRPKTDYSGVAALISAFEPYFHLWSTSAAWLRAKRGWLNGPLGEIDCGQMEAQVTTGIRNLRGVRARLDFAEAELVLSINDALLVELEDFEVKMRLAIALRREGLALRHWDEIYEVVGVRVNPASSDFVLSTLVSEKYRLKDHMDAILRICERAAQETEISNSLKMMKSRWDPFRLISVPFKASGTFVLTQTEDLGILIDEQIPPSFPHQCTVSFQVI